MDNFMIQDINILILVRMLYIYMVMYHYLENYLFI